ncbi:MAG TPA: ABC transporter ATP-binding protein, partial [Chloroflexota bacterium]|nr:ABC transporter ATP-binding protein [Chloroflexota bacterium]
FTSDGVVKAVDGVDLTIPRGKTLGLVGESGCGKSVTALSIMRLVQSPPGRIVGGRITFDGTDLLRLSEDQMNRVRGGRISMIFQEPMTSLNPLLRVGEQVAEAVVMHERVGARAGHDRAVQMLRQVGIPSPEQRVSAYPHELSGGMRQRVMIAIALACRPALLIADEPTTALDVTIQAQILDLLRALQSDMGMSLLLITHDLGVVAEMADEVAVMYAGKVVEQAPVVTLFQEPKHPYTQGLLSSIPTLDSNKAERLNVIRGSVPSLARLPSGCVFNPRCPHVMDVCREQVPVLKPVSSEQAVRCWLY